MPGSGREPQALQFPRAMKDYSPFRLRILFLRRCLAAYLSLMLLGLGAGIGRAEDKRPYFNRAPEKHEERLACTPVPKSDNPIVQATFNKAPGSQLVQSYQTVPMNLLKPQIISPVYSTYFKQAVELSRGNEDNRKQAVGLFGKAIELDSKKSFQDSMKLDERTAGLGISKPIGPSFLEFNWNSVLGFGWSYKIIARF